MKGGVFPPEYELECYRALAAAFPGDRIRFDPNARLVDGAGRAVRPRDRRSRTTTISKIRCSASLACATCARSCRMPLATNTVVVNFEQLAANVLQRCRGCHPARHDVLGRHPACVKAAGVCETFQLGVAVHSSGELGIQFATMLHLGAVVPNLSFAADAHYHHLEDDVIEGGKIKYENGAIRVPDGAGTGCAARPRQARDIRRAISQAGLVSLRSGSGQARLDAVDSKRSLGQIPATIGSHSSVGLKDSV